MDYKKRNTLTVAEAAQLLGKSEQFVRIGLRQGRFPWGEAVRMSDRWTYVIYRNVFFGATGIEKKGE